MRCQSALAEGLYEEALTGLAGVRAEVDRSVMGLSPEELRLRALDFISLFQLEPVSMPDLLDDIERRARLAARSGGRERPDRQSKLPL